MIEKIIYNSTIAFLEKKEGRKLAIDEKKAVLIYSQKQIIYKKYLSKINKIYFDIIIEYLALFNSKHGGEYIKNIIMQHFKPRFIAILTEIYLYNTRVFGRKIRNQLGFNVFGFKALNNDEMEINERFDEEISTSIIEYVNNSANKILNTIISDIEYYTIKSKKEVENDLLDKKKSLQDIIRNISFLLFGLQATNKQKLHNLKTQKTTLEKQIDNMEKNPISYLKNKIKNNLKKRFISRAAATTEQEIGVSQAMIEQTEAEVISKQTTFLKYKKKHLTKKWVAILDSRTRPWHSNVDGQIVEISDYFIVMQERLKFPRDPMGSAKNTARCRCEAIYNLTNF